jgi:hypothetical protein
VTFRFSFLLIAACSRTEVVETTGATARCLPVVAPSCGCVYSCGTGTEISPGKWRVTHPFWGSTPLDAKVAPWCVGGVCTDAFHAALPCTVICAPKPADATCHFASGGACVTGRDGAP